MSEEIGTAIIPARAEEVGGLMRLALEGKHPVEVLERLVALQERVTDRDARMAYVQALSAFRSECPQPQRTRENTQFSVTRGGVKRFSRYAPLDEIERVARPVAARHGLVWTWDTRVDDTMMHVTCKLLHVDGHSESATVSMPHESKAGASPQQKYGSTQTYGMRYSLIAALGITTADDDVDGAGAGGEVKRATEEQLADIEALITEVGADRKRFLAFLGIERLEDLPAAKVAQAIQGLQDKRRGR